MVNMFGKLDSIENHYQLSKRFGDKAPNNWKEAKRRTPTHMEVNGKIFPVECLTPWYKLLWLTYLDEHPELVEYARQFDDFRDSFEKGTVNNQADVIRKYNKEGREKLLEEIADFQKQL